MIIGLYIPGNSIIHRASAGLKIAFLFLLGIAVVLMDSLFASTAVLLCLGTIFLVTDGIGVQKLWQTTRPLIIWLVCIAFAQSILADENKALLIVVRLLALVWAAALVTLTTRVSDMMDTIVYVSSWLRHLGIPPNRTAFLIAMTIRLIPGLVEIMQEVHQAQKARGLDHSIVASVVPCLTRTISQADAISSALIARGYDSWDDYDGA